MSQRLQVDISTASMFRAFAVLFGFILLYLLSDVVIVLLFAIVIASAVQPFVGWLEERKVPRLIGVLLLYLMMAALFVLLSSLVLPSVTADLSRLTSALPRITSDIAGSLDSVQSQAPQYFDVVAELQNVLETIASWLQQFSQSALNIAVSAFGGIISFLAVLIISFYLAIMRNGVKNFLEAVIPERYEEYVIDLWKRVEAKVGLWLQGQMLLALIVGLMVYVGLTLLGVKYALVFALLAMALEIVPIAGPVLAAIPAIIMAFIQDPTLGLWTFLLYVGVQQLENNVLVPVVLGKTIGLNPIVVIIAILVGSQLAGIAGALLGVPVATIIVEILDDMAQLKTSRRAG